MIQRQIACTADYLHIPIEPYGPRRTLQIWDGPHLIKDAYLPITDRDDCAYVFISVKAYAGKSLKLILPEPETLTEKALSSIVAGADARPGNPLYPDLYREKYRSQYHFTTRRGWLNDPNGLFWADGIFHMYYQHNPLGVPHGSVNVGWGHAISKDLIEWEELDDAILPWRRDWLVASGSALVDSANAAGYGKNAVIAAFTALGTWRPETQGGYASGGQFLAASTDGGNSFSLFSKEATVPAKDGEGWRDPRIFHYKDHFVMAVYETEDGKNCVSFYRSDDLHSWTLTSRNKNLYECPDLFPLTVEETGEEHWVLYGGDGMARIGHFDGERFLESGIFCPLDYGHATYAGQTWNHHPEGKRIHISWVRCMGGLGENTGYEGMAFSQCMTLPCELTLQQGPEGLRVCRKPVEAVDSLRIGEAKCFSHTVYYENNFLLENMCEYEFDFSALEGRLSLTLREYEIHFDPVEKKLFFDNGSQCPLFSQDLKFRMFVDTTTVELFFEDGISASYAMYPDQMRFAYRGHANVACKKWALRSIWNQE